MCVIETRWACGNVVQQQVFPTKFCDCGDVVAEEYDMDEDCGYCSECERRKKEDGVRDVDSEGEEDEMVSESWSEFGVGDEWGDEMGPEEGEREGEGEEGEGMEMKIMGFPGDEIWADIFGNCMSVPKAQVRKIDMLGKSK